MSEGTHRRVDPAVNRWTVVPKKNIQENATWNLKSFDFHNRKSSFQPVLDLFFWHIYPQKFNIDTKNVHV